ncbi:MAG: DL-methionine transporter ATP-binding subunit [Legionellales bacterium RIFCSPHIGHO2_12_FULL_42_9]|nr:MAG: DL-methionine transporter ATP-binding subunit [Legionellales bacterium RIFCSPHIGHO2_12_FULL_42_9]
MIELIGLHKCFNNTVVLQDINLFIQQGEVFGIIGKSGAGKSTLLRTINLLVRPDQGQVVINNQNTTHLQNKALCEMRHNIGMIFQQFNLLQSKTVFDNIALPMRIQGIDKATIHSKVTALLNLIELEDKIHSYPASLSGGQKQRVAIARALSFSPKILLCDEATSALDPETTESILMFLKKINQIYNITTIVVTHEMDIVKKICHRLAVMDGGKIVEITSMVGLWENPNSLAKKMLYTQLSPTLPICLSHNLTNVKSNRVLLRLLFHGSSATTPFISTMSRKLHLNINILLANIDRFDGYDITGVTCGILVVELNATSQLLEIFIQHCNQANLIVEILGYVNDVV